MTSDTITLVKVDLTIADRWAVGTWSDADATIQLPVLRDPRASAGERPYLPATSLVGALRRHLRDRLGVALTEEWLGPEPTGYEQRTGTLDDDRLGRLVVLGCLPIDAAVRVRGATAVDGERGAASGTTMRTEQWVEPTTATLVAFHDGPRDATLLAELARWTPTVGRSRTGGLGRARASAVASVELDLTQTEHLDWWLARRDGWLRGAQPPRGLQPRTEPIPDPGLVAGQRWALVAAEPIHVGVDKNGVRQEEGGRAAPTLDSVGRLLVPGASWKGVFRHRTRVILRAAGASEIETDALVTALFGGEKNRGRLTFRDSVTTDAAPQKRTHVAIDRYTGGARDSALHAVLAIPEKTGLELVVEHAEPERGPVWNLLNHIVNDLNDGLITVGGHGTRGYGLVRLADARQNLELAPVRVAELAVACGITTGGERS